MLFDALAARTPARTHGGHGTGRPDAAGQVQVVPGGREHVVPQVLRQGHAPAAQPCSPIFRRWVCYFSPWLCLSLDALLRPALLLPRRAHARPRIDARSLLRIPPRCLAGVLLSEAATVCACAACVACVRARALSAQTR